MENVLILDKHTLDKFKTYYQAFLTENKDSRILYVFKNDEFTITVYNSFKVVFQGKEALREYNSWAKLLGQELHSEDILDKEAYENQFFSKKVIGSDEVGTGDFFGPVVVCSAYVTPKDYPLLFDLGVKDSKKLNDDIIYKIGKTLVENISYHILVLNNEKFNELTQKGYNMNKIKAFLHNHAIKKLVNKHPENDFVILDQFCSRENYFDYLKGEEIYSKIEFITKAESVHLAVACASIIARYKFLLEMEEIEKNLGMKLPKGAGPGVDAIGKVIHLKMGDEIFNKIAKLNFKNYLRIIN